MKRIIGLFFGVLVIAASIVFLVRQTQASPTSPSALVVHEWGTFTSIYGSDGTMLTGIERDEEALPPFVYSHGIADGQPQFFDLSKPEQALEFQVMRKGIKRPVQNVTVKMETPVLYFYSPEAMNAKVSVGFRGGSISQWYPARSGGEKMPPLWREDKEGNRYIVPIDFAEPYDGSIEWDITVEPRTPDTEFDVMKDHELPNWLHPRAPQSNLLRNANDETETYLFYRGLGNFEQPISYRIDGGKLSVEISDDIPFLIVLDIQSANYGRVLWSGKPGTKESIELAGSDSGFIRNQVYESLKGALTDAGLYDDEAAAMLRTWWTSYFSTPGLRAFWIVPRGFTDEVLPISVEPAPSQMERVLLGRSEILTPEFEGQLLSEFAKEPDENNFRYSRYFPAYQARVEQLKPSR
ncbi:MAG: hypothetical protein AAGA96_10630 [Verrucomicrobiota bacterium]